MVRCSMVDQNYVITHQGTPSTAFKTQAGCWTWLDKVKISNDDRRRLLKELQELK
jgi:hypothetical protein